jgi:hypothetical protein
MGYSTYFAGQFDLSKKLTDKRIAKLAVLCDYGHDDMPDDTPGSDCPWRVTADGKGLEDAAEEKMYDWDTWLDYIVEFYLKPWGVEIEGRVSWQGEDTGDCGIIFAKGHKTKFVNIHELAEYMEDTCDDLYADEE